MNSHLNFLHSHLSSPSLPPAMFPNDAMDVDDGWDLPRTMPGSEQLMQDLGMLGVELEAPNPDVTRALLQQEYERMLIAAFGEAHLEMDGLEDQFIGADQPKDIDDTDEDLCDDNELWETSEYDPYPSKAVSVTCLNNSSKNSFSCRPCF